MAQMSDAKKRIVDIVGNDITAQVEKLNENDATKLATILSKSNVNARINRSVAPFGISLNTDYGNITTDSSLTTVDRVYVNGQRFNVLADDLDAIDHLTGAEDDVKAFLGSATGRQRIGRKVRARVENKDIPFESAQEVAYEDMSKAGITYDSFRDDMAGLLRGRNVTVGSLLDELYSNDVEESDIAHFLVYDSQYKNDVISQVYGVSLGAVESDYHFVPVLPDDSFRGRLMKRLGIDEAEYDEEAGILRANGRMITNLPTVDKNGVFHNGDTAYLPYLRGYFTADSGSRIDRLRVSDPVDTALDAVALQWDVTDGDIRFKTLLDVTRNLPDFDNHPYGAEILDTLKHKIVFDKAYGKSNSLLKEYSGMADDLGAIALTMLDDDAKGYIDPLGTSNGSNMGKIVFMADGVTVNPDGSLNPSTNEYSKVGNILKDYNIDRDNFNRNQMSFNAFLTSVDVKKVDTAYAEFALWNSEDAVVMTKHGAETAFSVEKHAGDKVMDFHGNKSTIALIADADMSDEEAKEKQLTQAVEIARMNPTLDMIVSPISIASRLNMGVAHEGLTGPKSDLKLPDGTVVKDGVTTMMYMSLPQTSAHKSKNYELGGNGRRYSTLLRYGLSAKVGADMYNKALVNEETKAEHIDQVATSFARLGISFNDDEKLVAEGNVNAYVDAPAEIDVSEFSLDLPSVVRSKLLSHMVDGQININLGDMSVISPMTDEPIVDSFGENVLPIRVQEGQSIPYRYNDVFEALALGNKGKLQQVYSTAVSLDYSQLTRKDNLLKNIKTMNFTTDAHTDVLIPDPRLKLNEVRSGIKSDRIIMHRDPVIQSGNVMSVDNVKNGEENVIQINPLIETMMDADNDGDTLGGVGYSNLNLTDAEKDEFYKRSSVEEQVNQYGRVFLGTDNSHFKAAILANGLDDSAVTFQDGKSNAELIEVVEDLNQKILNSDKSYGAYSISFQDSASVKQTLSKLADDGIKGTREAINNIFDNGYTEDENRAVLKALIAKSEWTGLAGATTNNLISGLSDQSFDKDIVRVAMDVTHSMTQSVLQMKKNADKLPLIDEDIKQMKTVMSGKYDVEDSRKMLKTITANLIEPEAIDKFVDLVAARQIGKPFGRGVINGTETSTTKLAYTTGDNFGKALSNISNTVDVNNTLEQ